MPSSCDERNGIVTSSCRRSVGKTTTRYGTPTEAPQVQPIWNVRILTPAVPRIIVHDDASVDHRWPTWTCIPRVAMAILRHARFAITMEIYTEVSDQGARAELKKLGDSPE
jgi:hypothetical protein